MKFILSTLITLTLLNLNAATPEQKGVEIAKKMEAANNGFKGEESQMEMVLIDAYGAQTKRVMKGLVREVEEDGDMSISIFQNPKDVKGTKMLTHSHKGDNDDQWLYLPTVRRVKRISSSNKSSSFMGSEFSYEDLGSQEIEKYNFKWMKDVDLGPKIGKGWVIERIPKTNSGYTRMVMTVAQKYMNPVKVEYYDRKKELLKVAEFSNFKDYKVGGKDMWRSNKINMNNVQTKKRSIFEWKERKVGVIHKSKTFLKSSLKK